MQNDKALSLCSLAGVESFLLKETVGLFFRGTGTDDECQISPAEIGVLDCMCHGGIALSLKVGFPGVGT